MVERKEFGYFQGYRCELITLQSKTGMSAVLSSFGATVVGLNVPDRKGEFSDIALGYDTIGEYVDGNSCFGATVGRFANRIGGAKFTLNGVEYHLDKNDGENTLHSGFYGYNKRVWTVSEVQDGDEPFVEFSYLSPDGEQHLPGNLKIYVKYTLTENALKIDYSAMSDEDTIVNLTNHSYFNLKGEGNGDVKEHIVQINAKQYTPVDNGLIPTGLLAYTTGTPFDFQKPKRVAEDMDNGRLPNGYDHNFVLGEPKVMRTAAEVYEPETGRVMTVLTDSPAVQFYIGIGLNNEKGKNGHVYNQYAGLCLETQFSPDTPNKPEFPSCVLKEGDEYRYTTIYQFSTRD